MKQSLICDSRKKRKERKRNIEATAKFPLDVFLVTPRRASKLLHGVQESRYAYEKL